ncbi:ParA family protein [Tritonibacter scottomollicae]|uniref:Chromosome partitioning protein n=1 Tax=Tritonibacter scottomollicae TaxID=483013 RepID=A0A2T1API8_TRISK|nr:AAA family ATPase [Tritonibacter scottomollicae]PRZ50427.1 chromosome partitioning protein [Tritonibacter scottomollicae]
MKIIACYSNKGGVGKTAAAVNLAYAYAQSGARTLLCDLDPQGASSFYFRVKPSKKLKDTQFFEDVDRFARAIRGSDYENLDILPANLTFRDFDVFLSRMKNSRSRLKKALKAVDGDYDVIILDCPPNISSLSEAVFKAADRVVVPVIPTTLSERSFEQLFAFFKESGLKTAKLLAFFSMVQGRKTLHGETMARLRDSYGKLFLTTELPFSTDVEKMGVHREPALCFAKTRPAGRAYLALFDEVNAHVSVGKTAVRAKGSP